MELTKDSIIGTLVANNYKYASIFKQAKIDFCCNGNRSIEDACNQKGIEIEPLLDKLKQVSTEPDNQAIDFNSWPMDLLADYIEKTHHRYVEEKTQEIKPFLSKVARVHGDRHPELLEIERLFNESVEELAAHMKKEELILFPYLRKMAKETNISAPFGTVQNPIQMMMYEHDTEGERFRTIAALTNNYTPPTDACNTYRVTFALLNEFEENLHQHIHLENNILFPKAIETEEKYVNT